MLYAFFVRIALLPEPQPDDGQKHDGENSEHAADPFRDLVVARYAERLEDSSESGFDGVKEDGVSWRMDGQRDPREHGPKCEDDPVALLFGNRFPVLLEQETAPSGH